MDMSVCRICGQRPAAASMSNDGGGINVDCMVCGPYLISRMACDCTPRGEIASRLHLLSAFLRHQKGPSRERFVISYRHLEDVEFFNTEIAAHCPTSLPAKAMVVLDYVASVSEHYGSVIRLDPDTHYPIGYCRNPTEFQFLVSYLSDAGLLTRKTASAHLNIRYPVSLSATGWKEVEGRRRAIGQKTCFVAMWSDPAMAPAFLEGIQALAAETGIEFLRVDQEQFNGENCDRILADIRRSRFMIADVTGRRLVVHFEAGFAMGLGLPVIWTCRKDHLREKQKFDTRHFNHLVWETPDELRQKLLDRIRATLPEVCERPEAGPTNPETKQ